MGSKLKKVVSVLLSLLIASTVIVSTSSVSASTTENKEYRTANEHMPREIYIRNHARTFSKSYSKPPVRAHPPLRPFIHSLFLISIVTIKFQV